MTFPRDEAVNLKERSTPMKRRALVLVEGSTGNGLLYVQAARRLGLYPVSLAVDPSRYDYLAAESVDAIQVDTNDLDALKRACSWLRATHDIAGIVCFSGRNGTVAELCRYFGLTVPDSESTQDGSDEFRQRGMLARAGLPILADRVVGNATGLESAAVEMCLPVTVKPVSGSGAEWYRIVDEVAEHTSNVSGGRHVWQAPQRRVFDGLAPGPVDSTYIIAAAPSHQTERADFAPDVAAIVMAIAGVTAFAIAQGLTFPLISLALEQRGVSAAISGLNSGAYAAGLAVATLAVGRLTHLMRGDHLIVLGLLGCACSLAIFATFDPPWVWFVARFALGFCSSIMFVLSGARLNTACPNRLRGRVSGVYGMGLCGGFAVGPLAIPFFGTDNGLAFAWLASYVAIAAFLICLLSRHARTQPERAAPGELFKFFRKAPLLIAMVSAFAFADVAAISELPVYFVRMGHSATFAALSVTVLSLPSAIVQPLIGWLLDRTSRHSVAICSAFIAGVSFLAIPFIPSELGVLSAFALMGAAISAIYTCAVTMLGDRFNGGALVGGSAAFTLAYATGSAVGSSVTASAMELVAPAAGPIVAGIVLLAFTCVMIGNALIWRNAEPRS
ncbi:MFS transporter [Sinorhizobium meliloti]|uniref:MFS transporter n=1 Tax=Rhizobium meliloti TaxID=382 RepID=UPI001F2A04CF|nr:MFS transporter [Sinorhizobium meliloti]